MFIGHFAVGFGAKRAAPKVSLGALFCACQLADLIWPTLVLLGVETVSIEPGSTVVTPFAFTSYPYSHSLVGLVLWGALFASGYALVRRGGLVASATLFVTVVSHWVLDWITHKPDMPLDFGATTKVGLGLWNSLPGTLVVELALYVLGVALYARTTRARDRVGAIGFWSLVAFLLAIHAANLFGPPPPSVRAVAWGAESLWLIVLWGWWVDRHRDPVAG